MARIFELVVVSPPTVKSLLNALLGADAGSLSWSTVIGASLDVKEATWYPVTPGARPPSPGRRTSSRQLPGWATGGGVVSVDGLANKRQTILFLAGIWRLSPLRGVCREPGNDVQQT